MILCKKNICNILPIYLPIYRFSPLFFVVMLPYKNFDDFINISDEIVFKQDRSNYSRYMEVIERYIHANAKEFKIVVDISSPYLYIMYTKNPVHVMRELAKAIYLSDERGFAMYTTAITKIAKQEFSIVVSGRELAIVKSDVIHRGTIMTDLMTTVHKECRHAKGLKLKVISPELVLVKIYAELSNPILSADWSDILIMEDSNRNEFLNGDLRANKSSDNKQKHSIEHPATKVLFEYYANKYALVGKDIMANYYGNANTINRLQYITYDTFDTIKAELHKVLKMKHQIQEYDAFIPTYPKLRYITVYVSNGDKRTAIADIFDCGTYDIFPIMKTDICGQRVIIGTHQVQLMFSLVNIWLLRLQNRLEGANKAFIETMINAHLESYKMIANEFVSITTGDDIQMITELFPVINDHYVGVYIDDVLAKKRDVLEKKKENIYYRPYYPVLDKSV